MQAVGGQGPLVHSGVTLGRAASGRAHRGRLCHPGAPKPTTSHRPCRVVDTRPPCGVGPWLLPRLHHQHVARLVGAARVTGAPWATAVSPHHWSLLRWGSQDASAPPEDRSRQGQQEGSACILASASGRPTAGHRSNRGPGPAPRWPARPPAPWPARAAPAGTAHGGNLGVCLICTAAHVGVPTAQIVPRFEPPSPGAAPLPTSVGPAEGTGHCGEALCLLPPPGQAGSTRTFRVG